MIKNGVSIHCVTEDNHVTLFSILPKNKAPDVVTSEVLKQFTSFLQHKSNNGNDTVVDLERSSDISYFGDKTVLDGCIWVTLGIHLDIERRYEDHDGSGYMSIVMVPEQVISVIAFADGFLSIKHYLLLC